jgi:hypothetical protein
VVPFPLQTISAADVDVAVAVVVVVDIVDAVVVDVAVGFPNNLKKLKDGSSIVGQDLHGSALI